MISVCTCVSGQCNCPVPEIAELYNRNKNRKDFLIEDILAITDLFTIDIDNIKRVPYAVYWDFMMEVVSNIDTGKWTMHPYMWKRYIVNATYVQMTVNEIDKREKQLRDKCIEILKKNNISSVGPMTGNQLKLKWVRNPNGFLDILSTLKTMIELKNLFYNQENSK